MMHAATAARGKPAGDAQLTWTRDNAEVGVAGEAYYEALVALHYAKQYRATAGTRTAAPPARTTQGTRHLAPTCDPLHDPTSKLRLLDESDT